MAGREKWLRGLRGMLVEARWLDSMITMRNRSKKPPCHRKMPINCGVL